MDMKVSSTIGYERRHNDLLQIEDEDAFVERAISGLAPQPPNFQNIVAINRGPLISAGAEICRSTPRQVEQKEREGALIVDVRTDLQFDDAHISGSVSNTMLRAGFGTKLAWIAEPRPRDRVRRPRRRRRAHRRPAGRGRRASASSAASSPAA